MTEFILSASLDAKSEQALRVRFHELFNMLARKKDEITALKAALQRIQIELFFRANR